MIPKCFGGLRIKLHSLRYRGAKGTGNDTENRTELVLGEDEEPTRSIVTVVPVTSRRQSWEEALRLLYYTSCLPEVLKYIQVLSLFA